MNATLALHDSLSCASGPAAELQSVLEPFLLRRVKSEVAVDLPKKMELVVYHGMSALQKKYYKALLTKDLGESVLWCVTQLMLV